MIVPVVGERSLRLQHLTNTLTSCATFRRLVGAADAAEAATRVYEDLALDDDTEPLPRAVIRHQGSQNANRTGTTTFIGTGELSIFIQYEKLSDEDLLDWYDLIGTVTTRDHRRHMNNLYGQISAELQAVATTAGCLEYQRLEEFSCGELDPVTENGLKLVEMVWIVHREGLP
jgi:hypothetical protein